MKKLSFFFVLTCALQIGTFQGKVDYHLNYVILFPTISNKMVT